MKKFHPMTTLKHFFFPPAGTPRWLRILPYLFMGVLTLAVFVSGSYGWEYTNSSSFCGSSCHTMPPEYAAYQSSPHANVKCTECHIGRAPFLVQFGRKAGDIKHVIDLTLEQYEYPIHARSLRSAEQTCERCHTPTKFSPSSLLQVRRYADDAANTPTEYFALLKTGGGNEDGAIGPNIHWHATGNVQYLTNDPNAQDIPYVRVTAPDGTITEFYDVESGLTPDDIHGTNLTQMECVSCHNRISHMILSPAESVDQAMASGDLPTDLPELHAQAVTLLSGEYATREEGRAAMTDLSDFYQENYPDLYAARPDDVENSVAALQQIYLDTNYPEQKLNWETHPNNLEHKDFAGCFRCHSGNHVTQSGEALPFACDTCHTIPSASTGGDLSVNLTVERGPRPPTHENSWWQVLHGRAIDLSCATCHPPSDPTMDYTTLTEPPPPDGSFCGNSACHNTEWQFAGWNAPQLDDLLDRQLYILQNTSPYVAKNSTLTYEATFEGLFNGRCTFCHAGAEPKAGLDLSSYEMIMKGGKLGPIIIPGDPDASVLIEVQSTRKGHFGQVLDDELAALTEWIAAGAPEK